MGANSFIGKNFLKNSKFENINATYYSNIPTIKFIKRKYKYKKVNIKNYHEVRKLIKNESINVIINFIADNGNRIENSSSIRNIFDLNLLGFINIIESVKNLKKDILIYNFTSTEVDNNKISPYSISKYASEKILQVYNDLYNMKIYSIKLNNIFGPGDMNFSRIVPFICKNLCKNKNINLNSMQKHKIFNFTYIDDLTNYIDNKIFVNNKKSSKKIKTYQLSILKINKILIKLHNNYILNNKNFVLQNNIESKLYSTLLWYKKNI